MEDDEPTATHPPFAGTHAHQLEAYGDGLRRHVHDGDNDHRPPVVAAAAKPPAEYRWPRGLRSFVRDGGPGQSWEVVNAAGEPVLNVGDQLKVLGARAGIADVGTGGGGSEWRIATLQADGASHAWSPPFATYGEALGVLAEQLAQGDARPVLAQTWRSDMAFEGVSTGDGRYIEPGATTFRACPLPLMLQTVTDDGHDGAVLAGTIEQTGMLGNTAVGAGSFDDSAAGRQFVSIIEARGRFGVSIDVAEADGQPICATHGDDLSDCGMDCDIEMHFSMIKIMGVSGCGFPAFENAYIELVPVAMAAGGELSPFNATRGSPVVHLQTDFSLPAGWTRTASPSGNMIIDQGPWVISPKPRPLPTESPCVECDEQSAVAAAQQAGPGLTASAGPAVPPRSWFDDPQFKVGDDRLVRQPDGSYVCPMTVTPDGRIYGHFAGKFQCHTGYANKCVTMPSSPSDYKAFHLRPIETDEGEILGGHVTMGCGHADTTPGMSVRQVRDHYDGGPGATLVARVRVGEDAYGGWVAGAVCPEVSEAQIRRFKSLSLSGDWREVWRGKGLELVALLAGVPSPGFPVAAMAAAGFVHADHGDAALLPVAEVGVDVDGHVVALVAAGVVRPLMPWETVQAAQQRQIEELRADVGRLARIATNLRGPAAERLVASLGYVPPEPEPSPFQRLLSEGAHKGNGAG